ncbi:nucleotidyltransferase domain-containing protein [Candidatus Clostridium radicumherbarum]|uniref:Nucleotidyltransferase domain-containing protein n=1 Tax=Candidatus Clostridium radicumherbarum TaxID=3381662 RepID=A0ABW8TQC9_9CLOT
MTSDQYVSSIISKYKVKDEIDALTQLFVIYPLEKIIRNWASTWLDEIKISGSRAKGTAINLSSDLDLFISLKSSNPFTLKQIYNSLYDAIIKEGISARKQNVSIGINYQGHNIDLVPASRHSGNTNYHSLYKSKADSWTQTNIDKHINLVKDSGRRDEIIALKIWRKLHGLDFPSIYLELTVLEALYYKNKNQLGFNFLTILEYLQNEFVEKRIVDPSNTNNVISDDLYKYEKQAIAAKAMESRSAKAWEEIIW